MTVADPEPTNIEKLEWGAWPSFAMLAGIQLDLFTVLSSGPMTIRQIADAIGVRPVKLKPLLYALAACNLMTIKDDLFANSREADCFLVRGSPSYRGGKHEVLSTNWHAGLQTAASIRAGSPQSKLDFFAASEEKLERFYRSNHAQALRRGHELMAAYDFSSHGSLLDVGGGSGGVSIAITEIYPVIHSTVVDLPIVTPITRRIVGEAGATDRVNVMTADICTDELQGSYDAAVLSSFIQVISAEKACRAIKNIGEVIIPGGTIYIRGDVVDDSGLAPWEAVMRNLIYLNIYDEGQAYTESEHTEWLREAGFKDFQRKILPDGFSLMKARKA
jgi:SAM-dependent methyltransferase